MEPKQTTSLKAGITHLPTTKSSPCTLHCTLHCIKGWTACAFTQSHGSRDSRGGSVLCRDLRRSSPSHSRRWRRLSKCWPCAMPVCQPMHGKDGKGERKEQSPLRLSIPFQTRRVWTTNEQRTISKFDLNFRHPRKSCTRAYETQNTSTVVCTQIWVSYKMWCGGNMFRKQTQQNFRNELPPHLALFLYFCRVGI